MAQQKSEHEFQPLNPPGRAENEKIPEVGKIPPKGRMTGMLFFSMCAAAFGSSFQFGYNIGVVNPIKDVVQNWINQTNFANSGEFLNKQRLDFIWSVIVSIFAIGAMGGGLLSGYLAERFGRKRAMLLNNGTAFVAAGLLGFAKLANTYWLLVLGRFVIGINCGINSALAPLYLTEIAPVNLRGMLGTVNQLLVSISITIAILLGLNFIFGNDQLWPWALAFTAVPAIFQIFALPFCPETPRYLLINREKSKLAEIALVKLRGTSEVQEELELMQDEASRAKMAPKIKISDMFKFPLRWPLFLAVMLMFSQQLSGINVAMFYSSQIFESAGLKGQEPVYASIAMGVVNVVMTGVSTLIVDKFGRRILLLAGFIIMWIATVFLVIALSLNFSWTAYASIFLVVLFVIGFALGLGSIPWFYVSELFLQNARANATSIAVVANWAATFVVALVFLPLEDAIGQFSFLVFTFFLTFFAFFTWKFIPETKNRSVEEIVESLKKKKSQN